MSQKADKYALRFNWTMKMASESAQLEVTPIALLVDWFLIHYLDFFQPSNTAEVLEGFRKKLVARQVRGCTIDDIDAQVKRLITDQPNERGLSRMEILVKWFEANYSAYIGSTNATKAMISTLTATDHSSLCLRVLSDRLDRILLGAQARRDDRIELKAEPMDVASQHNLPNTHHDSAMEESKDDDMEEGIQRHAHEGETESSTEARVKIEWPGTPTIQLVALGRKVLLDRGVPIEEVDVLHPGRLVSRMLRYPFSPAEIQLRTKPGWKRQGLRTMGVQASAIDACLPMPSP
ncbi:hypothetical protein PHYSODRAFT_341914 [Phytophthora sojae]|uniref:Uncharacterized protein n=1 Tax=Phytophthora sojae (strain P6497) TaxID=1094619 RepID=G5AES1_PHYSP|nr:hypothetical protein PHYSODRAFT_341914 [Phytophthora sojae]EGZ05711.1 hypothetical protein PHYSODRAFT_341914 [Phytophthora sojae]|eukprot:XP_009538572.1 hypothetical protein PHYSODRAFT_341914 [Phytophthora sojae]